MVQAGLKTIILLSFVLALSFLLIILSCALFSNWLPLFSALIFLLAPLPNFLLSSSSDDVYADSTGSPLEGFGNFLTSIFIVSGLGLPFIMSHAGVINWIAGWMVALGGVVGYATVIAYGHFFAIQVDYV